MKRQDVIKYAKEVTARVCLNLVLFYCVYAYLGEGVNYYKLIILSVFIALTTAYTDRWMKKLIRKVMVAMHGEEKVKQNKEKTALKNQPGKN